jgi:hypothetical protein
MLYLGGLKFVAFLGLKFQLCSRLFNACITFLLNRIEVVNWPQSTDTVLIIVFLILSRNTAVNLCFLLSLYMCGCYGNG